MWWTIQVGPTWGPPFILLHIFFWLSRLQVLTPTATGHANSLGPRIRCDHGSTCQSDHESEAQNSGPCEWSGVRNRCKFTWPMVFELCECDVWKVWNSPTCVKNCTRSARPAQFRVAKCRVLIEWSSSSTLLFLGRGQNHSPSFQSSSHYAIPTRLQESWAPRYCLSFPLKNYMPR